VNFFSLKNFFYSLSRARSQNLIFHKNIPLRLKNETWKV